MQDGHEHNCAAVKSPWLRSDPDGSTFYHKRAAFSQVTWLQSDQREVKKWLAVQEYQAMS